jgi:hypothetical protein
VRIRRTIEWIVFAASSAVVLYAGFAAFDYALGPGLDNCANAHEAPVANDRGVLAGAMARWCAFIGLPNEKRLGLHLSDESGDVVLVYYEPRNNRNAAVLRWLGDDQLSVDLGEVTWLTPQVDHLGRIKISHSYRGDEPSLE